MMNHLGFIQVSNSIFSFLKNKYDFISFLCFYYQNNIPTEIF